MLQNFVSKYKIYKISENQENRMSFWDHEDFLCFAGVFSSLIPRASRRPDLSLVEVEQVKDF